MGLTRQELLTLKSKIKAEMLRRNGLGAPNRKWTPSNPYGSLSIFGDSAYDFTHSPEKGGKLYSEYGEKTVDLLLEIKDYPNLTKTEEGKPIPRGFDASLIEEVDKLSQEKFTGETEATIAARKAAGEVVTDLKPETSSCKSACSGLCVGNCIGECNGCLHTCTATCGVGCADGLMVSAR